MYGMGCSIAYKAYTLTNLKQIEHREKLFDKFVLMAMCISIMGNVLSCSSRFIVDKKKRSLVRIVPFVFQYIFVSLPLVYRFMYYYFPNLFSKCNFIFSLLSSVNNQAINSSILIKKPLSIENITLKIDSNFNDELIHFGIFKNRSDIFYLIQLIAALTSAFLYVTHVPERIWPGKFDLFGQSHQIFHLTTFLCTWSQFFALKLDMNQFIIENFQMNQFFRIDDNFLIVKNLEQTEVSKFVMFRYSNMPYFEINLSYSLILSLCFIFNFFILVYYYFKAVYFNPWDRHNSIHYSKSNNDLKNSNVSFKNGKIKNKNA